MRGYAADLQHALDLQALPLPLEEVRDAQLLAVVLHDGVGHAHLRKVVEQKGKGV